MAITLWKKRDPFEGLTGFFDDFDWFDNTFSIPGTEGVWNPSVDIEHLEGTYRLIADLPGVKKEDLHVELHDGLLTLKGVKEANHQEKNKNYHMTERSWGCFERSFRVPKGITEKEITASFHDGVLEITIPTPKTEKPKEIDIKID